MMFQKSLQVVISHVRCIACTRARSRAVSWTFTLKPPRELQWVSTTIGISIAFGATIAGAAAGMRARCSGWSAPVAYYYENWYQTYVNKMRGVPTYHHTHAVCEVSSARLQHVHSASKILTYSNLSRATPSELPGRDVRALCLSRRSLLASAPSLGVLTSQVSDVLAQYEKVEDQPPCICCTVLIPRNN